MWLCQAQVSTVLSCPYFVLFVSQWLTKVCADKALCNDFLSAGCAGDDHGDRVCAGQPGGVATEYEDANKGTQWTQLWQHSRRCHGKIMSCMFLVIQLSLKMQMGAHSGPNHGSTAGDVMVRHQSFAYLLCMLLRDSMHDIRFKCCCLEAVICCLMCIGCVKSNSLKVFMHVLVCRPS